MCSSSRLPRPAHVIDGRALPRPAAPVCAARASARRARRLSLSRPCAASVRVPPGPAGVNPFPAVVLYTRPGGAEDRAVRLGLVRVSAASTPGRQ